jgi:cytidine deaminase
LQIRAMTSLDADSIDRLVLAARNVMTNACCRHSGFAVGAALQAADGRIFVGVNVESSSFGGTICAERTALVSALTQGVRDFTALAITTDALRPTMPCGICRQLLHDYAPDLVVIAEARGMRAQRTLGELLPDAFGADDLPR